MLKEPVITITYRKPTTGELGREPGGAGLILSGQDVQLLRLLDSHPILVQLQSPGEPTFHVRIHALLDRLWPRPDERDWVIPATAFGVLVPAE